MRLTAHAREVIRNTTREVFGAKAHNKSITLAARLQMRLGDQPIHVVLLDPETPVQPIHREAVATGVPI